MALLPGGEGRMHRVGADGAGRTARIRWRLEGDLLAVEGEPPMRVEARGWQDGRARARLTDPAKPTEVLVFTRHAGPPKGEPYAGPLVGRWERTDGLPGSLVLLPDGRYERRRTHF